MTSHESPHAMRFDVLSFDLDTIGGNDDSLHWPVATHAYSPWAHEFPASVARIAAAIGDPDRRIATAALVPELARDASRIACGAAELEAARATGSLPVMSETISPVTAWLRSEEGLPSRIEAILPEVAPLRPGRRDWKTPLRALKRRVDTWRIPEQQRTDIHNHNDIVARVIASGRVVTPVRLYPDRLPFSRVTSINSRTDAIVDALVEEFRLKLDEWNGIPPHLVSRGAEIFRQFSRERLEHAWSDLLAYRRWRQSESLSRAILGGTPKVTGRLLGALYRGEGRRAVRCTHGGDRGFFDDPLWAFSELQEADDYWVHGASEAANIKRRLAEHRVLRPPHVPVVRPAGSPKHAAIWRAAHGRQRRQRDKHQIALVPGSFGGEWNHTTIAFKLPDALIADLQIRILRLLKEAGHRVLVKAHPKALLPRLGMVERFYGRFCDEIVTGRFDPLRIDADVFVFDFAGAAWFDALASDRGVLLIDTGNRPLDPVGLVDLRKRCAIVPVKRSPSSGYRLDAATLERGIEAALERARCSEEFAEHYFGLSLVQ